MSVIRRLNRPVGPVSLILWAILLVGSTAQAAGLSAEVDRNRIQANETLRLRIVADGALSGEPDLAPLDTDFEIIGRSTGTKATIVNGNMSQEREWVLELSPRRVGDLGVPSLSLAGEQTAPIRVQVVPAGQVDASAGPKPLYLDTAVDTESPYVQQGFVYRVKVMFREQPRGPTLSEPEANGATIEQLGDDQSYSEMVGGQRYQVIERRYLVIPQKSGPMTIRSPRLEARLPDTGPGARRGPFAEFEDLMGGRLFQGFPDLPDIRGGRRVVERGPDRSVQVRPQPAQAASPWLPAESVELSDEWSPSPPRFRVGEPVTRTLTITARGLTSAQLPLLDTGDLKGVNVYPDTPSAEDLPGNAPVSVKSLKLALVPTRAGVLTLPEIRLHWWDTTTDRPRVAVIPQRTVQVVAGEPSVAGPPPKSVVAAPSGEAVLAEGDAAGPGKESEAETVKTSAGVPTEELPQALRTTPWPWLTLLMGLGWLATLVWLILERRRARAGRSPTTGEPPLNGSVSMAKARRTLEAACDSGDPRTARAALLAWGRARWGRDAPRGLGALADRFGGEDLKACLDSIDQAIYAADGGDWDGPAAWRCLQVILDAASPQPESADSQSLPGLYPRRV